jgi:uncharacterized integral membrane protein
MDNSSSFGINEKDIMSVRLYRGGIVLSALAFILGTVLLLVTEGWKNTASTEWIKNHNVLLHTVVWMMVIGTGISVVTIHLYIRQFHRLLKILYGVGLAALVLFLVMGITSGRGFLNLLYQTPYGTFGFGFMLATLCGIAVKEAFCFGRAEAVLFAVVTPVLVLGHMFHAFSPFTALMFLCADTLFIVIFAARKVIMPVDLDIGDKSIYMQKT